MSLPPVVNLAALMSDLLSSRESDVVRAAAEGLADKEIASHLGLSVTTVRTYWERIRQKLGAVNRTQAVRLVLPKLLKEAEDTVRADAELFRFICESLHDVAIFLCEDDGTLLTWTEGVERLFGYKQEEWIGQNTDIFFTPEDLEAEQPAMELNEARNAMRATYHRWHVRKDGTRFWGQNDVIRFTPALRASGFAKVVRDESHLKSD